MHLEDKSLPAMINTQGLKEVTTELSDKIGGDCQSKAKILAGIEELKVEYIKYLQNLTSSDVDRRLTKEEINIKIRALDRFARIIIREVPSSHVTPRDSEDEK